MSDNNNLITEALHIADTVRIISDDVANELLYHIKNDPKSIIKDNKNLYKFGHFEHNDYGIGFTVQWQCYNFKTKEEFNSSNINMSCSFVSAKKTINIKIVTINLVANRKWIEESIQHEISHMFEFYKMGAFGKNKQISQNYETAAKILINQNKSQLINAIAVIIYNSVKTEQNAMANGAYKYLMLSDDYFFQFKNAIKQTEIYHYFNDVSNALEQLSQYNCTEKAIIDALKPYDKLSFQQLLKMAKKTKERMAWLIGRVVVKAMNDYKEKYGIQQQITHETIKYAKRRESLRKKIIESIYKDTKLWKE